MYDSPSHRYFIDADILTDKVGTKTLSQNNATNIVRSRTVLLNDILVPVAYFDGAGTADYTGASSIGPHGDRPFLYRNEVVIGSGDYTVSLWFKAIAPNDLVATNGLIHERGTGWGLCQVQFNSSLSRIEHRYGQSDTLANFYETQTDLFGQWYFVCVRKSGGQIHMHVADEFGNVKTNLSSSHASPGSASSIKIGSIRDVRFFFVGYMHDLRLWPGTDIGSSGFTDLYNSYQLVTSFWGDWTEPRTFTISGEAVTSVQENIDSNYSITTVETHSETVSDYYVLVLGEEDSISSNCYVYRTEFDTIVSDYVVFVNEPPTVVLHLPNDLAELVEVPDFEFTGTDLEGDDISYNILISNGYLPEGNIELHLDASSIEGFSNNDSVFEWDDLSPNQYSFIQEIGANRPLYIENAIGGQPALRFDGINHYFESPSLSSLNLGTDDWTFFVVMKTNSDSATNSILTKTRAAAQDYRYQLRTRNGYIALFLQGDGGADVVPEGTTEYVADNEPHLLEWEFDRSDKVFMSVDSTLDVNATISQWENKDFQSNNPLRVGASNDGSNNPSGFFSGDIAEIIAYSRLLTSEEHQAIKSYFGLKYGIGIGTNIDVFSNTDPGFTNTITPADTDPFNSGERIRYVLSGSLESGTYYWRVRGGD